MPKAVVGPVSQPGDVQSGNVFLVHQSAEERGLAVNSTSRGKTSWRLTAEMASPILVRPPQERAKMPASLIHPNTMRLPANSKAPAMAMQGGA